MGTDSRIAVDGDRGEIREMQLGIGGGVGFIIAAGTPVQRAGDDAGIAQNVHGGRRIDVGHGDRPGVARTGIQCVRMDRERAEGDIGGMALAGAGLDPHQRPGDRPPVAGILGDGADIDMSPDRHAAGGGNQGRQAKATPSPAEPPGPLNALAPSVMSPVIEIRGWMMSAVATATAPPPAWLLAAA